ncbi:hypothetical protein ACIGXA_38900 [Streptomyces fildesensis]|uniref:Transposase n=1 Tax=Streptomyces fildesensis TaxID=375757 RepID=A0ABW8CJ57_9ACTN
MARSTQVSGLGWTIREFRGWADQSFADHLVEWSHTILSRELEIVRKAPDQRGLQVQPKRWTVERTRLADQRPPTPATTSSNPSAPRP